RPAPSWSWVVCRHSFTWPRPLRTADPAISRARARALVGEWIKYVGVGNAISRRPDVIARRIISWLTQAPLLVDESDVRFYRRFIRSLTRQVRGLRVTLAGGRGGGPRREAGGAPRSSSACHPGEAPHSRTLPPPLSPHTPLPHT